MDKFLKFIKSRWFALALLLLVFAVLLEEVFERETLVTDRLAYGFFVQNLRAPYLTGILKIITELGGTIFLTLMGILSIFLVKNKIIKWLIPLNLVLSAIINTSLKYLIQRPRPEGYRLIEQGGFSFPSGHSMSSMAFYGFLIYLVHKKVKNEKKSKIYTAVFSILIILIGLSRIYLGVHYASDVLAGFSVGLSYLIVFCTFVKEKYGEALKEEF
ncbi:MAG: phosphatase PAP2 family protein [Gallicola sp.]|uniref:phosphatase PAP2 family protein n=1 Tax=Gallicola sp. Sow4_E12 TaxID=3438785 RepID=UPI00183501A4|nr:phosphatase PAP2 family protein [Gallicola sp.]